MKKLWKNNDTTLKPDSSGSGNVNKWLKVSVVTNLVLTGVILACLAYFLILPMFLFRAHSGDRNETPLSNLLPEVTFCADQRKGQTATELKELGPPLCNRIDAYIEVGTTQTFWIQLVGQYGEAKDIELSLKLAESWEVQEAPGWNRKASQGATKLTYKVDKLGHREKTVLPVTFKAPSAIGTSTPAAFKIEKINERAVAENSQPQFSQPAITTYIPYRR